MVQKFELLDFTAEDAGSVPGWGLRFHKLCETAREREREKSPGERHRELSLEIELGLAIRTGIRHGE